MKKDTKITNGPTEKKLLNALVGDAEIELKFYCESLTFSGHLRGVSREDGSGKSFMLDIAISHSKAIKKIWYRTDSLQGTVL